MDVKIKIKDGEKLLANADISIDTLEFGKLTIKNFQIWRSPVKNRRLGENVNVSPPSVGNLNMHFKTIFFEDMTQWENVEQRIWDAYQSALDSGNKDFT